MAKYIHENWMQGQRGVNLVEKIVLDMGFTWEATRVDAGIDGQIEIRDPTTGAMKNCILRAQVKERLSFVRETPESFEFVCDENDLDYWLGGTTPNILIVCRPSCDEAYWISIRDYFRDPEARKSRRIVFDKEKNLFSKDSGPDLVALARPKDSGLYLEPPRQPEALHANLLPVTRVPTYVYTADTRFRRHRPVFDVFKEDKIFGLGEFILRRKEIISVHDLHDLQWKKICDTTTVQRFSFPEWADEDLEERESEVRELLHRCLDGLTWKMGMKFNGKDHCFYFRKSEQQREVRKKVRSTTKDVPRGLVTEYHSGKPRQLRGYKHAAFQGEFRKFGERWFLEVTPTTFYTFDGKRRKANSDQLRKGIKQLERHAAVSGHMRMWSELLADSQQTEFLSAPYPYLAFGPWEKLTVPVSLPEQAWKARAAADEAAVDEFLRLNL
jgi:hypothetical protein